MGRAPSTVIFGGYAVAVLLQGCLPGATSATQSDSDAVHDDTGERAGGTDTSGPDAGSPPLSPQYRRTPDHRGTAAPGTRLDQPLQPAWQTDAFGIGTYTASKSSPAVDRDHIFVGVDDGRLLAVDRGDGALLWQFESRRYAVESGTTDPNHLGIHGCRIFNPPVYLASPVGPARAPSLSDRKPHARRASAQLPRHFVKIGETSDRTPCARRASAQLPHHFLKIG